MLFPVSCGRYRYDIERTVELEGPYTITDFIPLTVVMKERMPNGIPNTGTYRTMGDNLVMHFRA